MAKWLVVRCAHKRESETSETVQSVCYSKEQAERVMRECGIRQRDATVSYRIERWNP